MSTALTLRRMRPGEEPRLYEVLRASVLKGTARDYDDAQRRAWAPRRPPIHWADRLAAAQVFVAEAEGRVQGFMSVTTEGELDLAYVLPEMIGRGIGGQLLARAEHEMRLSGVTEMTTAASKTAQPFFARHGWVEDRQEVATRDGQRLPRVRMHKTLG